jgi:protein involved in polysaccharide export with SLBB domain
MPSRAPALAVAVASLLLAAAPAVAQTEVNAYGVKPGDEITTDFYTAGGDALTALQGQRLVDRDGNVFLAYVGTVHVEGLDAEQIRELLVQKFEPFYNDPVITVNVRLKVNVTGVVGVPGHYLLDPTSTIVDALATAGGAAGEVTTGANIAGNPSAVLLVRDGETMTLDLRPESVDRGAIDMRIQSGDWIHVPPLGRSRLRDEFQFWGGVLSLFTSIATVIVIIAGN